MQAKESSSKQSEQFSKILLNIGYIDNGEQLKAASESGDIDLLYSVIQNDPYIFEHLDLIPFVETPLHIAASRGHLQVATEIMMLKPSFSCKLNVEGFSPIHLALQNGQTMMVSRFVDINKELVKVKGREGITPLHFASQIGDVYLLASFLFACPKSIECLTVRQETALHIAVKNEQFEALELLVGWLKTNYKRGSRELEKKILNQKDEAGNTILHISAALISERPARFLVKTKIDLKAKNLENKTALDIASTTGMKKILLNAGAKPASQVTDTPTRPAHRLSSKITIMKKMVIFMHRIRRDLSEEQRNTWLIVATLVATVTYESIVSPPGGVYQANASDNNVSINSSNPTITLGKVGTSVLSESDFFLFSISNTLSFFISIIAISFLTPRGWMLGNLVFCPVISFVFCYIVSLAMISPTLGKIVIYWITVSICFVLPIFSIMATYYRYQEDKRLPICLIGRDVSEDS